MIRERESEVKAKRKREEDRDAAEEVAEQTGSQDTKRRRKSDDTDAADAKGREKAEKRKEKRLRKKEKAEKKKAKAESRKEKKDEQQLASVQSRRNGEPDGVDADGDEGLPTDNPDDLEGFDASGLADLDAGKEEDDADSVHSSAPTTPVLESPAFDVATNHSTASSSSSIDAPSTADGANNEKKTVAAAPPQPKIDTSVANSARTKDLPSGTSSPKIQLPQINDEELQARLRARIEALRAARKADGPDGKPAKSRQELLDQRRKKEEQRKANKKAQRQKAKEDEQRRREEQLRGSGSPLSRVGDIFSPQPRENNFSFSRLAFEDGSAANADMTELRDARKKKGPQDPRTALQAAQNREAKIAGFDEEKRANIAEKDMWFNASKRAHGERVRDDTSLLKKALKRKEKQKSKSEREWKEREQAVVKGKEVRQKKREANLAKRRDEKGKSKKGGAKKKPGKGRRPGFEGRLKV